MDPKHLNRKPPVPQAPTPKVAKKVPGNVTFNPDIYGSKSSNPYLKKKPEDLAKSIHIDESEFFKSMDPNAVDNTKETVLEQNMAQVLNDHWDARKGVCEPCHVPKQLVAYAKMPKKSVYGREFGVPDTKNIEPIFGEANSPQDRYVPPTPPMDTASMYGVRSAYPKTAFTSPKKLDGEPGLRDQKLSSMGGDGNLKPPKTNPSQYKVPAS